MAKPKFTILEEHGKKTWLKNGKLHRTDGPAHISEKGVEVFGLDGCPLTFEDWVADPQCTLSDDEKKQFALKYGANR